MVPGVKPVRGLRSRGLRVEVAASGQHELAGSRPLPTDMPAAGGGSASGGSLGTGGLSPSPMATSQHDTQAEIWAHQEALCIGLK